MINVTKKPLIFFGIVFEISRDINGNKTVKVKAPWAGRGFSVQTNGNLPKTHRTDEPCYKEICDYVQHFGTNHQKKIFGIK